MRRFLLGHGWLLILTGVASAIAAPWSATPLIELLAVGGSLLLQTAGVTSVASVYADRHAGSSLPHSSCDGASSIVVEEPTVFPVRGSGGARCRPASERTFLELGASERCIGGAA